MAESGLTAEHLLASDTFLALETLSSTREYKRIVEELEGLEVRLDHAPFADGRGEMAARAVHTIDVVLKQTTKRWKFFKRLIGIHRYLLTLYLIILLVVGIYVAITGHFQGQLNSSVVWWLVLGNLLGLVSLGAISQVDKNTLSELEKIEKLKQKKADLINALKLVQTPELSVQHGLSRVPIRDDKGQLTLIRHQQSKPE